jgi:hypothetical protein
LALRPEKDDKSRSQWIDHVLELSDIKPIIADIILRIKIPIETIAEESLQSSNIPSDPKDLKHEDICKIIKDSTDSFTNGAI